MKRVQVGMEIERKHGHFVKFHLSCIVQAGKEIVFQSEGLKQKQM